MNRLALVLVAVMLAAPPAMTAQPAAQADKLLAAAQHKATVEGDLKGAIEMYRKIVSSAGANRTLAAQALLAMAECHEKLGQRDAATVYERIVREFADQGESVSLARTRLSAMQNTARTPAGQTVRQAWSGAGVDPMGTPSADGRYLSFTDWETGDLALRDLVANTSRRLTSTGGWQASGDFAEYSVLSPDGRQVAYAWFTDKGSQPNATRCVCRYEIRVSGTGADSGKPKVLLQADNIEWVRPAAFTPDGRQLVVVRALADRTFQLALITLADASFRVVKSLGWRDPSTISMSPDGRSVVYDAPASAATAAYDIVLLSLDDARETRIIQSPAHDRTPVWSFDGSHVLFISNRTGSDALWRLPMLGDKPAGPPALVVAAISGNSGLLGTAKNGAVYYWTGGQNSNIYFADLDDRLKASGTPKIAIEQFLNSNWAPSWSPDGARVAYLSRRGSNPSAGAVLMIHTMATGEDREVPLRIVPADRVSWFPDGQSVLVASREQAEGRLAFFRVDLATGESRLLLRTKGMGLPTRRPEVSPDGRAIVYVDRVGPEMGSGGALLLRFDLASGQDTELKRLDGKDDVFTSFAISPDGGEVAYARYEGDGRGLILEVIPQTGGPSRTLFRDVNFTGSRYSGLAWTNDKRSVIFARTPDASAGVTTTFWKVPVDGGPGENLGISSPRMIRFPSIDPKGGRLMFEGAGGGAEPAIWVVENFLPRAQR